MKTGARTAAIGWLITAVYYFYQYTLRSAPAVMMPQLSSAFGLTAAGVAGGFLLTFAIAISAYATPAILGGPGAPVMATMIRTFMIQLLDWAAGSAMGAILLVTSIALVILTSAVGSE